MIAMKKLIILLFAATVFSLCGCRSSAENQQAPGRAVSYIHISCKKTSGTITRLYTSQEKVQAILRYMRGLTPIESIELPAEAAQEDLYEITVHLYNGEIRTYQQKGHHYAALNGRSWCSIKESAGIQLGHLMALLPSD